MSGIEEILSAIEETLSGIEETVCWVLDTTPILQGGGENSKVYDIGYVDHFYGFWIQKYNLSFFYVRKMI